MTRLTYVRQGTELVSKNSILCNDNLYNVVINESTLEYSIVYKTFIINSGQGITLTDCKKRVKRDLIALGANFTSEIRNRGRTEKL